jgi:hypothetical protein
VLKPGYTTDLNGTSREFRSQGALGVVFVLALLFIFLVLAAQFESFIDPLVIMLSVPLSMIGALLALQWSGGLAQRVFADRPDHAGGPDHQARHPDRRVHQPAARAGHGDDGCGGQGHSACASACARS